jgi:putative endonuclease
MGIVYILQSLVNQRYYIGSTNDLTRRLREHEEGKTKSIRFIRPCKLVFSQEYATLIEARKIEYKLKKLKSRVIIERIIGNKVIHLGP